MSGLSARALISCTAHEFPSGSLKPKKLFCRAGRLRIGRADGGVSRRHRRPQQERLPNSDQHQGD
ncbi:MAG TPA: hypothetical protein VIK04_16565, partial [Solirubrobacteraceae bacterium]